MARLLCAQNKPEGLDLYDEAIQLAGNDDVRYVAADLTRQKARAYAMLGKTKKAVATALTAADMFEDEAELAMGHGCELLAGKILIENQSWVEAITLFTTIAESDGIEPQLRKAALLGLATALRGQGDFDESDRVKLAAERIKVEKSAKADHDFLDEDFFED